eukprot:TRINITY_DN27471_c0_g1_i3.p1 TRINITY_DN27471_c0_g1~~TRINITY_DN27471_c0_g1_i3.p1  ORF type:complete len:168 (-),score=32.68 TRINITY_DN27471_c0_g1_i3:123-626(-)
MSGNSEGCELQTRRLQRLEWQLAELAEAQAAFHAVAFKVGTVKEEQFLAEQHKRKFAAVLARHPVGSAVPFKVIASSMELLLRISAFVKHRDQCALKAAGSSIRRSFDMRGQKFRPLLFVCGGHRGTPGSALCSTESFDPLVGRWEPMPPMPHSQTDATVVSVGTHV